MSKYTISRKLRDQDWKKSAFIHAKKRLKERYDIDLTPDMFQKMTSEIKNDRGNLTIEKHNGTRIVKYRLKDKNIFIGFSDILKAIKTFLPPQDFYNHLFLPTSLVDRVLKGEVKKFIR